MQPLGKK